jgi:hypothetical protein
MRTFAFPIGQHSHRGYLTLLSIIRRFSSNWRTPTSVVVKYQNRIKSETCPRKPIRRCRRKRTLTITGPNLDPRLSQTPCNLTSERICTNLPNDNTQLEDTVNNLPKADNITPSRYLTDSLPSPLVSIPASRSSGKRSPTSTERTPAPASIQTSKPPAQVLDFVPLASDDLLPEITPGSSNIEAKDPVNGTLQSQRSSPIPRQTAISTATQKQSLSPPSKLIERLTLQSPSRRNAIKRPTIGTPRIAKRAKTAIRMPIVNVNNKRPPISVRRLNLPLYWRRTLPKERYLQHTRPFSGSHRVSSAREHTQLNSIPASTNQDIVPTVPSFLHRDSNQTASDAQTPGNINTGFSSSRESLSFRQNDNSLRSSSSDISIGDDADPFTFSLISRVPSPPSIRTTLSPPLALPFNVALATTKVQPLVIQTLKELTGRLLLARQRGRSTTYHQLWTMQQDTNSTSPSQYLALFDGQLIKGLRLVQWPDEGNTPESEPTLNEDTRVKDGAGKACAFGCVKGGLRRWASNQSYFQKNPL